MNKYIKLSDFEINRRIAEMDTKNRYVYFEKEQTIFRKFNNGQTQKFNPCNYPSDVMPIIIESGIAIRPYKTATPVAFNAEIGEFYGHAVYNENVLRAAMELFLLMKDAENNNETSSSNDDASIN
ncbi:phage protein NinX family protein [Providencia huaxiensis]|uniref:phage protein NinX family protein n=1 Tax=Providencia huaxiensis TaxID=2027290 RepID=UPI003756FECD